MADEDYIEHIGVKRRSGRYPWGSGENHDHANGGHHSLLNDIKNLKAKGVAETDIAKQLGFSTTTALRKAQSLAIASKKDSISDTVKGLKDKGMSSTEISKKLNMPESTVRFYINNSERIQNNQLKNTTDVLKKAMQKHPYLDIGSGTELQLGISRQKLLTAVSDLEQQGYYVHKVYIPRLNDKLKNTTVQVLSKEKDISKINKNRDKISPPNVKSRDGGLTYSEMDLAHLNSIDWDRVKINYKEDGGPDRDGLIQIRKGAKDLDLGTSTYAQVRIPVGGTHYIKGMAIYSDDIPKGKDIVFNTNKSKKEFTKEQVLKPLAKGDNPFAARIIPDSKGALYLVNKEGDWDSWNGSKFPAQFLSKQPVKLVHERITDTLNQKKKEYDEISNLTNPVVRQALLTKFAEAVNKQEKELKVKGLPNTKAHVLMPYPDMKPNEVYAPNYKDGERVVLIRYPHAGRFEIPELTVNNRAPSPKKSLGQAKDAIGIHPSVAAKLSGADFDGDAVYVIPNNQKKVKAVGSYPGLKNFDPNSYTIDRSLPDAPKRITKDLKQKQMGMVSNLITDMTIKGASVSEMTRAVKHSMVVIDAYKHDLDWKKSERDNGIRALAKRYASRPTLKYDPVTKKVIQGPMKIGGSTLISRASSTIATKTKTYEYTNKNGNTAHRKVILEKKPVLDLLDSAAMLSSGSPVEKEYVTYVDTLKALSNKALKQANNIPMPKRNPKAVKLYSKEVASLNNKLKDIYANRPYERRAQILANEFYKKNLKPGMEKDAINKLKRQSNDDARRVAGSKTQTELKVHITDKEWEAIQANAISPSALREIMAKADDKQLKQLATPHQYQKLTASKLSRAKALQDNGYTLGTIAESLGVSLSTLKKNLAESD